jgi:hypothetical protein
VEQVAWTYWRKKRAHAIQEIELKLSQFKTASPNTIKFWLAVHAWLEKKADAAKRVNERKAFK